MLQSDYVYHLYANQEMYNLLECADDIRYDYRDKIEDLNLFKRELERANLMTPRLSEFIDNYTKFSND